MIIGNYATHPHYYRLPRYIQYSRKFETMLTRELKSIFENEGVTKIICDPVPIFGFAMCNAGLELNIPITIQAPYHKFWVGWSDDLQERVKEYLDDTSIEKVYNSDKEFGRWRIDDNTISIVKECDLVLMFRDAQLDWRDKRFVSLCNQYNKKYWNVSDDWAKILNRLVE